MSIFVLIVGIPFVIVLVAFFKPDLLEKIIREPSGAERSHPGRPLQQPGQTPTP